MLEFLVFYPGFLKRFLEAGIEDILVENSAGNILDILQELTEGGEVSGPEQLMEALPGGPERSYVSRLLISSPFLLQEAF